MPSYTIDGIINHHTKKKCSSIFAVHSAPFLHGEILQLPAPAPNGSRRARRETAMVGRSEQVGISAAKLMGLEMMICYHSCDMSCH